MPIFQESLTAKPFNLKTAVGREKAVQAIDGHRECINCVVTFWVMSQFLHFLGASRGCADFRDPTAVFRLNIRYQGFWLRVRHEITGTIGRPRFVIGARRDEGA